jgi:hypothetical protein
MKRLITIASVAAVAAVAALAQGPEPGPMAIKYGGIAHLGLIGPVVKGQPYSADVTTEMNQTLSDGTHIHRQESYKIYRDGEGRMRRESGSDVWISDPVANTSYVLDTAHKTAHKMPLAQPGDKMMPPPPPPGGPDVVFSRRVVVASTDGMPPLPPPGPGRFLFTSKDAKHESLGKQVMAGVEVEGTRTTVVVPEGQIGNDRPIQIVHEVWKAPDLQVVMYSKNTDPQMGEMIEQVTSLQRGEPDPALFTVPAGYQVQ